MRWLWRGLVLVAVLLVVLVLVGGGYGYYRFIGLPFSFNAMLNTQAVNEALRSPQLLSQVGFLDGGPLDFHSGNLDTYSLVERADQYARLKNYVADIEAWDKSKLDRQEALSYDIVLWSYQRRLANEKYPWLGANGQLYPVNQAFGVQKDLPNFLLSRHQIRNAKLARTYVERLRAMGPVLDAVTADIRRQAGLGVIPPDFIVDDNIDQIKTLIAPTPERNAMVTDLGEKTARLSDMDPAARKSVVADATVAVRDIVYPAYRRMIAEEQRIRPRAVHIAGVWRLKGGAAYYADQLKALTSTDMAPDDIHAYGLSEVDRITKEADTLLQKIGLTDGTVGQRLDALMADPRFLYRNTDDDRARMLARYREILARMHALLPSVFLHIPKLPLDVRRVPPFAEKGSAGAYYEQPSLDGSKPGIFFANLRNVEETPTWTMPTLAYHEGIPGHHMQLATALEIQGLPLLRRVQFLPAFGEGWALYAEHLASDMGVYRDDPMDDLGRLQAELFRATRLVVDTGLHAKQWSREQAIDYMQKTTGMALSDVTAEIERYVVWPGQACAYKIGMKMILGLREKARAQLGDRFRLKEYHALVLDNGAMPLWLLERNVDRWIAERRP
jgi:uncharacterized protein (DUF885 family)